MDKTKLCAVCKKEACISPNYTAATYCSSHFRALIEKRVRKDLRILKAINVKLPYYFEEDGTPLSILAKDILTSIFEDRLHYSDDKSLPVEQHIFPACLEQCTAEEFDDFLAKGNLTLHGVRPLRSVCLADAQALLPKEDFSAVPTNTFLKDLEKKQSGSIFAMSNVFEFLKNR